MNGIRWFFVFCSFPFFQIQEITAKALKKNTGNLVYHSGSGSQNNVFLGERILINTGFLPSMKKIEALARKNCIKIVVMSSYRSEAESQQMKNTIVDPARHSNHLVGYAIDFNIRNGFFGYYNSKDLSLYNKYRLPGNIKKFIKEIRRSPNLRWGGDFKKSDPVHIDNPYYNNKTNLWKKMKISCEKEYIAAYKPKTSPKRSRFFRRFWFFKLWFS